MESQPDFDLQELMVLARLAQRNLEAWQSTDFSRDNPLRRVEALVEEALYMRLAEKLKPWQV